MGAVAAVAAALLVALPTAPSRAADDAEVEVETREVVDLQLRIAAGGRDVGRIVQLVELDTDTSLALEAEGHEHAIEIKVRKADDAGKKLAVTLGYEVDGQAVMSALTIEAAAKKAKIVRSDGGDVALSLTLAPKKVSVDQLPSPPRPPVELAEDINDPLAGI
ncbi:MAG: hypothetical protein KDK70_27235 [Myxococcales bacterium]|nr:hypothetical protein [Myxococcales bacterium]